MVKTGDFRIFGKFRKLADFVPLKIAAKMIVFVAKIFFWAETESVVFICGISASGKTGEMASVRGTDYPPIFITKQTEIEDFRTQGASFELLFFVGKNL